MIASQNRVVTHLSGRTVVNVFALKTPAVSTFKLLPPITNEALESMMLEQCKDFPNECTPAFGFIISLGVHVKAITVRPRPVLCP